MESLRDVRRVMEREVKKGSCPLMFERIEFGGTPFQLILSEEKLDEVLAYLLRLKSFRQYAEKTVINNVYMDLDMLCRKPQFKRTHSVMEREGIYTRVQRYKKKLNPHYENGLCLETVRCIFTLPEGEAEKCRMTHEGQETYAFIMSNKYILGLFTHCEAARKSVVSDGVEYGHLTEQEQKVVLLENVGYVLFQALLLDDVVKILGFAGIVICGECKSIFKECYINSIVPRLSRFPFQIRVIGFRTICIDRITAKKILCAVKTWSINRDIAIVCDTVLLPGNTIRGS